jgi:hypothetical protein
MEYTKMSQKVKFVTSDIADEPVLSLVRRSAFFSLLEGLPSG